MKIEIHDTTYVFLLLSFLAGYFEYMYLFLLVIFIHESGHYILGLLNNIKLSKIIIYPFGGITVLNCDLNVSIKKELLCLIGGILFQILFFLFVKKLYENSFITYHIYNIIKKVNILLISFNFMPILPLDGGKLLNIFLDKLFPYKYSYIISIIISCIFIFIFFLYNKTIFSLILSIFLIKSIIEEIQNIKLKYNKFLLERYLNNYKFKKTKIIKNINNFKRDNYHIINNIFESKYLSKIFDRQI